MSSKKDFATQFQNADYNYQRVKKSSIGLKATTQKKELEAKIGTNLMTSIKKPDDPNNTVPKFYPQKLSPQERSTATSLSHLISDNEISVPKHWTHGDLLRFSHLSQNDPKLTIKSITKHVKFLKEMQKFELTEEAAKLLSQGCIYIAGRAKDNQPIIVLDMKDTDINDSSHEHSHNATLWVLMTVRKYMLLGGYCESYHVFINLDNKSVLKYNVNFLKKTLKTLEHNFYSPGGTTYIYNPSWGFNTVWSVLKSFLTDKTINDMKFVKKGEEHIILEKYNGKIWEKKFGGLMENLKEGEYWPSHIHGPNNMNGDFITKQDIHDNNLHVFWILDSFENDNSIWKYENNKKDATQNSKLIAVRAGIHGREFCGIDVEISPLQSKQISRKKSSINNKVALGDTYMVGDSTKKVATGNVFLSQAKQGNGINKVANGNTDMPKAPNPTQGDGINKVAIGNTYMPKAPNHIGDCDMSIDSFRVEKDKKKEVPVKKGGWFKNLFQGCCQSKFVPEKSSQDIINAYASNEYTNKYSYKGRHDNELKSGFLKQPRIRDEPNGQFKSNAFGSPQADYQIKNGKSQQANTSNQMDLMDDFNKSVMNSLDMKKKTKRDQQKVATKPNIIEPQDYDDYTHDQNSYFHDQKF